MGLREYRKKRDFSITPEPAGVEGSRRTDDLAFVIQKHAASHLHYDFRLELGGVLLSWSIPKGPSLDPSVKRLAMHTEDHPIAYGDFEGIIPKGQYGGGTVLLWDRGRWIPIDNPTKGYHAGKLKFVLEGEKLHGGFTLVKTRGGAGRDDDRAWLLIKENDAEARSMDELNIVEARPESVATGRSMDEIASAQDRVWHSNRAEKDEHAPKRRGANRREDASKASLASRVKGAQQAPLPKRPRPELPAPAREPPAGDQWMHEIDYGGARVMARVEDGEARLFDASGKDVTSRFAEIAEAVAALGVGSALIDGEIAVMLPDGTTAPPPRASARAGRAVEERELVYFVFDLIHLEGYDLSAAPLLARKATLERLLGAPGAKSAKNVKGAKKGVIRYGGHIAGSGEEVFRNGCRLSLKGIVSKQIDAPYEPGRHKAWVVTPCAKPRASAGSARKRATTHTPKRATTRAPKRTTTRTPKRTTAGSSKTPRARAA
jgi:bifunctional non-homologous end joining protein LigD